MNLVSTAQLSQAISTDAFAAAVGKGTALQKPRWREVLRTHAMAVGVGLAFLDVDILPVAAAIGLTTFVAVTLRVMVGPALGAVAGQRTEIIGGFVLMGIGTMILFKHLGGA